MKGKLLFRYYSTHKVFNQSKQLKYYNLYNTDPIFNSFKLLNSLKQINKLKEYGEICGSNEMNLNSLLAEKNKPILKQFDSYGRRIDIVDFHESYYKLMGTGLKNGVSGYGHLIKEKGSHLTRAILLHMQNQLEPGHCCPLVMTTAAVMPLRKWGRDDLADKLCVFDYDPENKNIKLNFIKILLKCLNGMIFFLSFFFILFLSFSFFPSLS